MFRLAYGGVKIGASNVAHPTLVNMMEMNGARMGHLHWSRGKTAFGTFNTSFKIVDVCFFVSH